MKQSSQSTITNAWLCQIGEKQIHPVFAHLKITDGKIGEIQPADFRKFLQNPVSDPGSETELNAAGRVITVPLINFHDHFYSRLAKGLPISGPLDSFLNILKNLWWKLDRALDLDMVQACAQMAVLESIRQGVTYIFDHHASPDSTRNSLSTIAGVMQDFGLRGALCFETSDRNGFEQAQEALQENANFIRANAANRDMKGMLGLHALFTLGDDTLWRAHEIVEETAAGIHIHLAEGKDDPRISQEKYQRILTERLLDFQLLNEKSILAHGIYLTEKDYKNIANSGAAIVYNPDSNLNNAVGLPNYQTVPEEIPILVGTDGMSANIARSLKQLFLLYRHQGASFDQAFYWFIKIYFNQLAFVRKYFPDFPSLKIDQRADFVIWDYVPPTPFTSENFWGHFIYGILERPVHSVIQNGQFLMRNHRISGANLEEINLNIYRQGSRLFNKMKE